MNLQQLLAPRFRLLRPLGAGGAGRVLLVEDLQQGSTPVALKLGSRVGAAHRALSREFGQLGRLRHPHVVTVLELGRLAKGQLFLLTEHIKGPDLRQWAQGQTTDELALVTVQMCRALHYLHARGVVHGDIKPENILVEEGPWAKLVDFGLAETAPRASSGTVSGTLRFLAPEVLAGEARTASSDLFALGVTLAEVLPPQGELAELSRWLMAEQPAARPQNAEKVILALEQRTKRDYALPPPELAGRYFPSWPFVGRTRELERLATAEQGVFILLGPRGIGKTSLLDELRIRFLLDGRPCLRSRSSRFGGLLSSLWSQLGLPPRLPGEDTQQLERAVDVLLSRILREKPPYPVLLLDDVRPDDEPCLRLLARLCRSPLLCCATMRAEEWPADGREQIAGAAYLPLEGLSIEEVRLCLEQMFPQQEAISKRAEMITAITAGNPRRMEELLRSAIETSSCAADRAEAWLAGRTGDLTRLARQRLGHLDDGVRTELAELALYVYGAPPALVSQLDTLLAHGLVVQLDGLVCLANPTLGTELLEQMSVEEKKERRLRIAHKLEEMDTAEAFLVERGEQLARATMSAEAVSLLAKAAGRQGEMFDLTGAIHLHRRILELSPPQTEVHHRSLAALARLLRIKGDLVAAGQAHSRLIALAPDDGERAAAELDTVETLIDLGEAHRSLELLEKICHGTRPKILVKARYLWAKVLIGQGDYQGAEEHACRGIAIQHVVGTLAADLQHIIGLCRLMQGSTDEALEYFARALTIFRANADLLGVAKTLNSRGIALQRQGSLAFAAEAYHQALDLALQLGELRLQIIYTLNAGTVAQQQRLFEEALRCYREGLLIARSVCLEPDLARLAVNLANLLIQLGELGEARSLLEEAEAIARRLEMKDLLGHALLFLAELTLLQGDYGAARQIAEHSASCFKEIQLPQSAGEALLVAAQAMLEAQSWAAISSLLGAAQEQGYPAALTSRALWIEGQALVAETDEDPTPGRALLEEALYWAKKHGQQELMLLAHQALAETSELELEQMYHTARAEEISRSLVQSIPVPFRAAFQTIHLPRLGAVRPGSGLKARLPGRQLFDLLRINRELTREHDHDRVLELILDRAIELTSAERGFVILEQDGRFKVALARNMDQEIVRRKEFKFSRSVAERVIKRGEPIMTDSAMEDERFSGQRSVHELQLRSILCVPLRMQERVLGALYLDHRFKHDAFTGAHLELLAAFSDQAAIALANAHLIEEAKQREAKLAEAKELVERLNAQLRSTVEAQAERLDHISARLSSEQQDLLERYRGAKLVTRSKSMYEILRLIDRVAPTDIPVLLQGETGTGKEMIAKALHYNSLRRGGPFVSINCAAIPATLLESELFGHARGAFTGAVREKAGLFQVAAGGTLMLDEIGDMPLDMQAKLLRVLQEGKYRRVGEEQERTSDARIVSASLHDLAQLVADHRFRQDLFFRLNVMTIVVPPLRERHEDIPALVRHFLDEIQDPPTIDPAAMQLLLHYHWPGNVRQLQNEIQRAAVLTEGIITPQVLSIQVPQGAELGEDHDQLAQAIAAAEKRAIERALVRTHGSATKAARLLGISRVVLHRKLRKHGIRRLDGRAARS